jgi:nitroreductase/NAD-dependent dihydropyrimidine dehydrogenase PreA subunit
MPDQVLDEKKEAGIDRWRPETEENMSLFTVNRSLCKGDGKCSLICPVGIIAMDEDQGIPVPVDCAEERCIHCGHCVAICPHGAFSLDTMPVEKCLKLPAGWNLSVAQVEYLLKGRRSIRVFKEEPVDRAILEKMIDIARYAPSGTNRQPVRWMIIHDPARVNAIAQETIEYMKTMIKNNSPMAVSLKFENLVAGWENGRDFICRRAPHLVLAYGLKDDMIASGSCMIAGAYFELAALPHGVGTCWAGYAQMAINAWPAAQEIVKMSKKSNCFAAFLAGYPRVGYSRIPLRNDAKIIWR